MGYKDFAVGEVLTSQDVDNFLMRQTVMVFDDSTARTTALSAVLVEGMTSYLKDTDSLEYYDGSSWLNVNDNTDAIPKSVLAAQGDLIYGASAGSATALSVGTAGQFLTTNGTVPSWTDISTAGDIITTQGDLIIGDASGDPSRLAIGTADQVLTSNGTTMTWADAGGGGAVYTEITSGTVTSASLSITSIPGTYDDLILKYDFSNQPLFQLNGVTSGDYDEHTIKSDASTPEFNQFQSFIRARSIEGRAYIPRYTEVTEAMVHIIGQDQGNNNAVIGVHCCRVTSAPVTSIQTSNLITSGTFQLLGVTYVA